MPKQYMIFCEWCSYRKIANDTPKGIEGLVPIKTSKVPGGVPKLDATAKKVNVPSSIETMPKYKCPKCGRGVTAKRLPKPLHEPTPQPEKKNAEDLPEENMDG